MFKKLTNNLIRMIGIDEKRFFYVIEPTLLKLCYTPGKEVCRPNNVP